jgi:hypothetical protein
LVGLLWSLVAVALDEPSAVVAVDEAGHGLAKLLDGEAFPRFIAKHR